MRCLRTRVEAKATQMHSAGYANSPWRRCSRASTNKNPLSMTIKAQRSTNKFNLRTLPIDFSLFLALSRASGLRESSRAAIVTFSEAYIKSWPLQCAFTSDFISGSKISNISFRDFTTNNSGGTTKSDWMNCVRKCTQRPVFKIVSESELRSDRRSKKRLMLKVELKKRESSAGWPTFARNVLCEENSIYSEFRRKRRGILRNCFINESCFWISCSFWVTWRNGIVKKIN